MYNRRLIELDTGEFDLAWLSSKKKRPTLLTTAGSTASRSSWSCEELRKLFAEKTHNPN